MFEETVVVDEPSPSLEGGASASGYNPSSTYLAFASDRHGVETAISSAMSGMPSAVSYICLMGDMVNGTKSYTTSAVLTEAQAVFGKNIKMDITCGDHDKNCSDDAGIFHRNSELIETGWREGNVLYYVYGVSMSDMTDASAAETAAAMFMKWVDENCQDTHIPIIVVSHVPIHAARGDNFGGAAWNRALNYAATGYATTES